MALRSAANFAASCSAVSGGLPQSVAQPDNTNANTIPMINVPRNRYFLVFISKISFAVYPTV
jgi:hypothetical protein